jgi:hypothetical protein
MFPTPLLGAALGVGYAVLSEPTLGAYLDNMFPPERVGFRCGL